MQNGNCRFNSANNCVVAQIRSNAKVTQITNWMKTFLTYPSPPLPPSWPTLILTAELHAILHQIEGLNENRGRHPVEHRAPEVRESPAITSTLPSARVANFYHLLLRSSFGRDRRLRIRTVPSLGALGRNVCHIHEAGKTHDLVLC